MSNTLIKNRQSGDIIRQSSVSYYRFGLRLEPGFSEVIKASLSESGLDSFHPANQLGLMVPIASFNAPSRLEDTLSRWTQRICSNLEKPEIEFNNFSGIPPHTIYLRILDASPLRLIMAELRKLDMYLTGNNEAPLHAVHRFMLPIAENIEESKYDNLMYRFGRVGFHGKTGVKSLSLQQFQEGGWKDVQQFPLSNPISRR